MEIENALQRVQAAVERNISGDPIAHTELIEEIHKLMLTAETPHEKTTRLRFQPLQNLCIRLAIEYGLLQFIASQRSNPVTAAEVSRHTGANELLISRIMRVVTYVGICNEVDYATYSSNDTTDFIVSAGSIGAEKHHTDLGFKVGAHLVEMVRQTGIYQFPEGPDQKNPFEFTYGMPLFEYFEIDNEQKEAFDAYMTMRRPTDALQWFDIYQAEQELENSQALKQDNEAVLLVDVGAGRGHDLVSFHKRFPHLPGRLILQDLPSTIGSLPPNLGVVEPMAIDFFVEQPIRGARIYYFRQVLHDWSDEKCKVILSNIVKAMDPNYSRIILDEFVLPDTGASGRVAALDFLMMMFNSGIERSERQWKTLLESVGLEIVRVWPAKSGREAVIEAGIRQS